MWRLGHFALCPFCRTVRLMLAEKQVTVQLVHVAPWMSQPVYPELRQSGLVPLLKTGECNTILHDHRTICEFVEDSVPANPLIGKSAEQRAQVRQLASWLDRFCYDAITLPLLVAAFSKVPRPTPPSAKVLGKAAAATSMLLDEIAHLIGDNGWLSGPTLTLADLTAAAHLSVVDYFGAVHWSGHQTAQDWYWAIQARPSFAGLLTDRIEGIEPPPQYTAIDYQPTD